MSLRLRSTLAALLCAAIPTAYAANYQDHYEFEVALAAPYRAAAANSREFGLQFRYPGADDGTTIAWRLDIVNGRGTVLRTWRGESRLRDGTASESIRWNERDGRTGPLPWGHYETRLSAVALDGPAQDVLGFAPLQQRVDDALSALALEAQSQSFDIEVGSPARPAVAEFARLGTAQQNGEAVESGSSHTAQSMSAPGGLPYTVYFGNLHSQTNHSDGGGDLATCTDAENPQAGAYGPATAYQYGRNQGLDILMTSEHNHLYDGSTGTNASANPATAKNLYQSGLSAASTFNAAHPGFLAVYGMEWGVINNGGHLNIFNSSELLGWEYNSSNQLLADTLTEKSNYAALYTLMQARGWVGQFNHPASSGQFLIGSTALAYSAAGDTAMVLAEVLNSSAFSHNTAETETSRSSYESAWKTLLTRGFHVAPSTDQDNHCANWGASYTNRTAVLIPNGTALTQTSFIEALRARRVFATTDKTAQLVLTANGHLMGERFNNSGSLALTANYAPGTGRSATQVQIFEGVPGANGTVTQLASSASTTITPSTGAHFYYAKITQDNGTLLWSAPVWVTQGSGGGDTTAPTVSASESGSSGTISLGATASDAVGVTRVEFLIDGALKATDTSSPYSASLDSTSLANGTHSLIAKAYDAANNVGTSSAVSFSVSNSTGGTPVERIGNGGFESGATSWTATSGVIDNSSSPAAHAGSWKAWLNGYGSAHTDSVLQSVTIPSAATSANLSFWLRVVSDETTTTQAYDTVKLQVRNSSGTVLATLGTWSNLDKSSAYAQKSFSLLAYKGQTVQLYFVGIEGSTVATSFLVDDVSLMTQ
ncbi:MAG: CehA/McbA family metallohydrolase [Tahibacter sp.]